MKAWHLKGADMGIWVISGVAGSGKTSVAKAVAKELGWDFMDADDFHPDANRAKMGSGRALDEADREPWLVALSEGLVDHKGGPLVLAFPGLRRAHRKRLEESVEPRSMHWAVLEASLATVEARLDQRGGFFPIELAASQFKLRETEEGIQVIDAEPPLDEVVHAALAWVASTR